MCDRVREYTECAYHLLPLLLDTACLNSTARCGLSKRDSYTVAWQQLLNLFSTVTVFSSLHVSGPVKQFYQFCNCRCAWQNSE